MDKKKPTSIFSIYHLVFQYLKSQPKLYLPFGFFVLIELCILFLLFLSPRAPFNVVLGPPIRAFWGEKFLHYPLNFLLLPKLASLSRNLLACVIGSILTGLAVTMLAKVHNKQDADLPLALKLSLKKYFSLFTIVFIMIALFLSFSKVIYMFLNKYFNSGNQTLLFLEPQVWLGPIMVGINLVVVLFVQGMLVYAIPLLMIAHEKLYVAVGKSVLLFFKWFLPTLAMVGLPILLYIPVIVLQLNTSFLIDKVFPETVLYVCIAGVIINSLIIDLLVTLSTTVFYLQNKE